MERAVGQVKVALRRFAQALQVKELSRTVPPHALPAQPRLDEVTPATAPTSTATAMVSGANSSAAGCVRKRAESRELPKAPQGSAS